MVSNASDDFPDPLTPVTMISLPVGSVTSMFLRLWVRAPRTTRSAASAAPLGEGSDMRTVIDLGDGLNNYRSAGARTRQGNELDSADRSKGPTPVTSASYFC